MSDSVKDLEYIVSRSKEDFGRQARNLKKFLVDVYLAGIDFYFTNATAKPTKKFGLGFSLVKNDGWKIYRTPFGPYISTMVSLDYDEDQIHLELETYTHKKPSSGGIHNKLDEISRRYAFRAYLEQCARDLGAEVFLKALSYFNEPRNSDDLPVVAINVQWGITPDQPMNLIRAEGIKQLEEALKEYRKLNL